MAKDRNAGDTRNEYRGVTSLKIIRSGQRLQKVEKREAKKVSLITRSLYTSKIEKREVVVDKRARSCCISLKIARDTRIHNSWSRFFTPTIVQSVVIVLWSNYLGFAHQSLLDTVFLHFDDLVLPVWESRIFHSIPFDT
jgi:hypothetical protein